MAQFDSFLAHEWWIRLGGFASMFVLMALAEFAEPARALVVRKRQRWFANLSLLTLNTVVVRLVFPGSAVGIAVLAQHTGSGLLHVVRVPEAVALVVSLLVLDLGIYLQHILFHSVPALWRLHSVHHADLDFDVTTGSRFHPLEMLLSMLFKGAIILALGPPWLAVLIFEMILNAAAVFNHANVHLPLKADRSLRWVIVTPDMHRIHHSAQPREHNSNFGFNLPWWDRLFGTYVAEPRPDHAAMTIGLPQLCSADDCTNFARLLMLPFNRCRWLTQVAPR